MATRCRFLVIKKSVRGIDNQKSASPEPETQIDVIKRHGQIILV